MRIISPATCPVGEAAGHDADECRANLLEDHSIYCVTCDTSYPKMSDKMRRVFRAIASSYGAPIVHLGSNTKPCSKAYDASCLCGYDPAQSDHVRAHFANRDGDSATLEYDLKHEEEITNPDLSIGRALSETELAALPPCTKKCVSALELLGFRVRHIGTEHGLRVVLSAGHPVGSMGFVFGAALELNQRSTD